MNTPLHWTAGLHHDGSALYLSNQEPKLGDRVTIKLRAPAQAPIQRIFLRTAPDGENHLERMHEERRDDHWIWWWVELPVHMPANPYRFKILSSEGAYFLNQAGVSRVDGPEWNDFKLLASYASPTWTQSAVFYQIFPDRFNAGDPANHVPEGAWEIRGFKTRRRAWGDPVLTWKEAGNLDYYGGDLPGITQKIPYLVDLGINALYLNPIFVSHSNHRYDVSDFYNVDPYLGGNQALADLRRATDEAGIKIMLDVTLNHLGWRNPWFTEAQQNLQNATSEYFTFYDSPEKYESWLGVPSLPKFNYRSEKLRQQMYQSVDSVLRTWLRPPYRIDGWRLDVANMQARQGATQLAHKVGRQLRRSVKEEAPQMYLIGEHFYDATTHLQGDELDATMNYAGFAVPLWRWLNGQDLGTDYRPEVADPVLLPAEAVAEQWTRFRAPLPWQVARHQFNLMDSHDTSRILHKLGEDKTLLPLATAILMTYPGTPSIYYGTEIGLTGGQDPDNRRTMPWDESAWDHDLLAYFKRIIKIRRTSSALIEGGFQMLHADGGLIAYQRQSPSQRLTVVGHRGPDTLTEYHIPLWHSGVKDGATLVDMLTGSTYRVENGELVLPSVAKGTALLLEER